jgi:RNA polymerase sigma-70 factor (ECF subfamily)
MQDRSLAKEITHPYAPWVEKGASADMNDEASLVAAARRDPKAFGVLYHRYATRVYRYLYSHVDNAADAEDLTAQVFMSAWESLERYREQGNFPAWLFSISRNKVKDFYRRQRQQLPLDEAHPQLRQDWDSLDRVELDESLCSLSALVEKLDPDQQELLRLRFAADLSYAEIAGILKKREAAVKMAMTRLLRQLRAAFNENAAFGNAAFDENAGGSV